MKKIISLLIVLAISIGTEGIVSAKANYTVSRIDGATRYETSTNIANNYSSGKLENIIIASGDDFPDALSGCVLSSKVNAPILLVGKDTKSSQASINFIKSKLNVNGTIYVLGGESSVNEEIGRCFKSLGYNNIKRLGGINRFDTNKIIINALNTKKGTPVFIVNGFDFADALSVSSIAGSKEYPIILSDSTGLPDEAKDLIKSIEPSKIFIVGGENSIGSNVIDEIKNIVPMSDGSIARIGGNDRYETSLNVCKYFNLSSDTAVIASGENFPDALSSSALAAKLNAPIILTNGINISSQKRYLDQCNYKKLILLGGIGIINNDVENILEDKPAISDSAVKELLFNGDEAFQNVLRINVDGSSYVNVSGISYAKVTEDLSKYSSIYQYLNKNYGLNSYYTDRFIKSTVNSLFTNIDSQYYIRYGNPEPRVIVRNSKIVSKQYDGNKVYVYLKGYSSEPDSLSYAYATLTFDGNRWLIDKFDNWGM